MLLFIHPLLLINVYKGGEKFQNPWVSLECSSEKQMILFGQWLQYMDYYAFEYHID